MVAGVDTASNISNVASDIKNAGYLFACRYYSSNAGSWKIMSTGESAAIANAGLKEW